jgi:hypothetical protein
MSPPPDDIGSAAAIAKPRTSEPTRLAPLGKPYAVPVCETVPASGRLAEAVYRSFEILAAGFALAATLPLLLILAALIRLFPPASRSLDHGAGPRATGADGCSPAAGRIRAGTSVLRAKLLPFAKIPHDVRGFTDTLSRVLRLQICVRGIPPAVPHQSARPAADADRTDPAQAFRRRAAELVVRVDRTNTSRRTAT